MTDSEAQVTRQKTLGQDFSRLRIDENDLYRIGQITQTLADKYGGAIEIQVVSADGEDTFRSTSPGFFISSETPVSLRSVAISYSRIGSPVSCGVRLVSGERGHATLAVDGSDAQSVSGFFREMQRELAARSVGDGTLTRKLHSSGSGAFLLWLVLAFVIAAAVYSLFDLPLDLISYANPGFWNSPIHVTISNLGLAAVAIAFMSGPFGALSYLQACFPKVQFAGKLSDPSTAKRKSLIGIGSVVILPLVLNVLAGLLTTFLTRPGA
jgi:hypothetical protein